MRMDTTKRRLTADEIVNRWSEKEIADLLLPEADEHDPEGSPRRSYEREPLRDTAHLATTVAGARKQWGRQRLHPATKTFLALRIAVNREMEELGQFLSRTPAHMNSGWPLGGIELPLAGRPPGEARVSRGRASRNAPRADKTRYPQPSEQETMGQSAFAKREAAVCGKSISMARKKKSWALTEFHNRQADRQFADRAACRAE